jgi:ketosteroid isomerase-like protein
LSTIEDRLAKLELEMERRQAVTEIQNCIGRYEGVHKAMTMHLTPEVFALTMPDVSMEVSDWGVFVGPEAVRFQFEKMMQEERIGCMFDHYVATPVIEVAGDAKTARAKFDSPGHETQIDVNGGRKAYWTWGSYSADFIKEADGRWRIWHLKWWRTFRTDYYKSWADDWQNIMTGPAHENDWPAEPCTFFHPYDTKTERWPFPLPPEPYESYEGTGYQKMLEWALGGERYKGFKEAYFEKYKTPTGAFEYAHGRKPGVNVNNPAGASFRVTVDGGHVDSGLQLSAEEG